MTPANLIFNVITLFPEAFPGPLAVSVIGKALERGLWALNMFDLKNYSENHQRVDDRPYSGGPGMLIKPDVVGRSIEHVLELHPGSHLVYLSASGARFDQERARGLLAKKNLTILCGRFEGIDQRAIELYDLEELSIGDYVLSGGEVAAMAVIDCCVRLFPGVVGNLDSTGEESFSTGNNLEYPQYTRPASWQGLEVPEVLRSGDHAKVARWKELQSLLVTKKNRPDLLGGDDD